MSPSAVVLDSNVLIGAFNPKDDFHKPASKLLSQIERGKVGETVVTDYVLDEILTFVRRRLGYEKSIEVLESILASDALRIEKIELREFQAGIIVFGKYRRLSFTDSVTVAYMNSRDMERLYSFDKDFDGIPRIQRLTSA